MTKTMTESLSVPIFMYGDEIDTTQLLILRKSLKSQYKSLSILPFFIKATSLAMHDFPILNV